MNGQFETLQDYVLTYFYKMLLIQFLKFAFCLEVF